MMAVAVLQALVVAGPLLFGSAHNGWVMTNQEGVPQKSFTHVAEVRPVDLAVSTDATRWAVVGDGGRVGRVLFLVDRERGRRRIKLPGDECSSPVFSSDGASVYLSANDLTAKPRPGERMNYVQLWKVDFASGEARKLTDTKGCHMWPAPLEDGRLVFSHATCVGGRGFEILGADRKEQVVIPPTDEFGEPVPHPRLAKVAFWRVGTNGMELGEWDLTTGTETRLGRIRGDGDRLRLAWHADERSLLFQSGTTVWKFTPGAEPREVFQLSDVRAKR